MGKMANFLNSERIFTYHSSFSSSGRTDKQYAQIFTIKVIFNLTLDPLNMAAEGKPDKLLIFLIVNELSCIIAYFLRLDEPNDDILEYLS